MMRETDRGFLAHRDAAHCSEAESRARIELAAAYRVAALEGLDDGVFNHFSLAVPGEPGHFLLKPFGPMFGQATATGLIKIDFDGNIVEGEGVWEPTAFHIHSRIHRGVPRARCVLHTHMPFATALTGLADMSLLPINQSSMRFIGRTATLEEYGGLVLDAAEGDRIVEAFQEKDVLLMANHGVMVIGETVAKALYDLHYLEVAARDQWYVLAMNRPLRMIPDAVVRVTVDQMREEQEMAAETYLAAMRRRLDREDPSYAA